MAQSGFSVDKDIGENTGELEYESGNKQPVSLEGVFIHDEADDAYNEEKDSEILFEIFHI
jgi:hypothetical protein